MHVVGRSKQTQIALVCVCVVREQCVSDYRIPPSSEEHIISTPFNTVHGHRDPPAIFRNGVGEAVGVTEELADFEVLRDGVLEADKLFEIE